MLCFGKTAGSTARTGTQSGLNSRSNQNAYHILKNNKFHNKQAAINGSLFIMEFTGKMNIEHI
ncbi:hypothetical protein CEQ21_16165 [Niallia circulans]|uniref:Uncharacterized protein n=1 Tax=Niallia circulans TaxID=1397 RepID=A0A553SJ55_NIACI|nr:hypothetical protein CEQ21_16165 [Niallia circulans]